MMVRSRRNAFRCWALLMVETVSCTMLPVECRLACGWEGRPLAEERLLTVSEVADRIRVSEYTVRNWLRAGRLRGSRPGGTKVGWRIPESEVRQFLANTMNELREVRIHQLSPLEYAWSDDAEAPMQTISGNARNIRDARARIVTQLGHEPATEELRHERKPVLRWRIDEEDGEMGDSTQIDWLLHLLSDLPRVRAWVTRG